MMEVTDPTATAPQNKGKDYTWIMMESKKRRSISAWLVLSASQPLVDVYHLLRNDLFSVIFSP